MLVPYGDSDEEEVEASPPAKAARRFEGDFFAAGAAAGESSSDEEDVDVAAAPLVAQLPAERPGLLPSVDSLFDTVERPAFLEAEARP